MSPHCVFNAVICRCLAFRLRFTHRPEQRLLSSSERVGRQTPLYLLLAFHVLCSQLTFSLLYVCIGITVYKRNAVECSMHVEL